MKILVEYFKEIEKLFDWYFHLTQIKRIQLNYIIVLICLATLTYKNDEQHRKNYSILSARIDTITNARAKEQREYAKSLQLYFEKVTSLLEKSLKQKEELQQIKEKQ
jgi:hypothetical protein